MRYDTAYGTVTLVETAAELQQFETFIAANGTLAVDTETTGLDIFTTTFAVRLVQQLKRTYWSLTSTVL